MREVGLVKVKEKPALRYEVMHPKPEMAASRAKQWGS